MKKNISAIFFTAVMFIICVAIFGAINGISDKSRFENAPKMKMDTEQKTEDATIENTTLADTSEADNAAATMQSMDSEAGNTTTETTGVTGTEDTRTADGAVTKQESQLRMGAASTNELAASQSDTAAIDSIPAQEPKPRASNEQQKEEYLARLDKIEQFYKEKWDNFSDTDMTSMNILEQQEHDKWDEELNIIYGLIKRDFPEDQFTKIRDEERKWIKMRDEQAAKQAAQYKGGTMETLEYTAALTDITKERTYELVNIYFGLQ